MILGPIEITTTDNSTFKESIMLPAQEQATVIYQQLINRCKSHLRSLRTVQFDPETGIRRIWFNGKLEGTEHVRGVRWNSPSMGDNNG